MFAVILQIVFQLQLMLASRLAKSGRSLSIPKGFPYRNLFGNGTSILKLPVATFPTHKYQCFSTTTESNEEGVETSSHKLLIESRFLFFSCL